MGQGQGVCCGHSTSSGEDEYNVHHGQSCFRDNKVTKCSSQEQVVEMESKKETQPAVFDLFENPQTDADSKVDASPNGCQPSVGDPVVSENGSNKEQRTRISEGGKQRGSGLTDDRQGRPSQASGNPFPKRPMFSNLSQATWDKAEELFCKMDSDGTNAVSREEARAFFSGSFQNASVEAMFSEIDVDMSGAITATEFMDFWKQVRSAGYGDKDITDEMEELMQGGAWVDWNDQRNTTFADGVNKVKSVKSGKGYPRRPWLCRINQTTWSKIEELFRKLDGENKDVVDRAQAERHFTGAFSKVSINAMFNEVDVHRHGNITPKAWIDFWLQVRHNGYSNQNITEEVMGMIEGGAWVDWNDGRTT
eukprot:TRINITY_DN4609_c0_g1_i1.p1 TRINITY_DN4609_c0_g1~~TRINITY_DN4609_c0_g1_i1.p1  ORF type:complete len:364 (-),score=68.87 TRINITY_DN4609_c0_g1_i1:241-1332(-)